MFMYMYILLIVAAFAGGMLSGYWVGKDAESKVVHDHFVALLDTVEKHRTRCENTTSEQK